MGGLVIALAKMSIASQQGMELNLSSVNSFGSTNILFSETQSRIVASINSANKKKFEQLFANQSCTLIGKNISKKIFTCNISKKDSFRVSISDLTTAYKKNIQNL
jgi:phosphoribosylformylglycinamidine synthase